MNGVVYYQFKVGLLLCGVQIILIDGLMIVAGCSLTATLNCCSVDLMH